MVKQVMSRGFTILESIIVLLIISVSLLFSIPVLHVDMSLYQFENWFKSELVVLQTETILNNEKKTVEITGDAIEMKHTLYGDFDGSSFSLNALGRVSKALSVYGYQPKRTIRLKVWLGMGKMDAESR